MTELEKYRIEIDASDKEIVELLCRRMAISAKIGEYKLKNLLPVTDAARESALIAKIRDLAGTEFADSAENIYRTILAESRAYQQKLFEKGGIL